MHKPRAFGRADLVCLCSAWIVLFVIGTDLFIIGPLLPALKNEFDIAMSHAAAAVSIFSFCYMACAPLTGRLADRYGKSHVAAVGLIVFALANAATAATTRFEMLVAARAAAGIAASAVTPSIYALLRQSAPPGRQATWLAFGVSGLLCGLTAGTPAGLVASAVFGWRIVFAVIALCAAVAASVVYHVWIKRDGAAARAKASEPSVAILRAVVPTLVWSTALYAVYTYLAAGLAASGMAAPQIARVLVLYGLGAIVGTFLGGRLADRFGSRVVERASLIGLSALLLLLCAAILAKLGIAATTACVALASVLAQFFFPAQQAYLGARFVDRPAAALAWNNSALFLGITLGSLSGGAIYDAAGFAAVLGAAALCTVAGVIVLPAFVAKPEP